VHRHLLDVEVAVDDVGEEVADGHVGGVGGDPGATRPVVAGEYVEGEGLVVGYLRHADIAEALTGGALDVPQDG
jgi:hypothetical protein